VETHGSAILTEEIPAERAVAAIVSRKEITDALEDADERPALLLQIARQGEDGQEERSSIGMTWSRDDLEQLLERGTGDQVILTFDREQLSAATSDVEAHGLRERALVFAVAAVGALGSGATLANAMPSTEGGSLAKAPAPTVPALKPASSGGLGIDAPSPIEGLIGGGVALAVIGATFVARRAGTVRRA